MNQLWLIFNRNPRQDTTWWNSQSAILSRNIGPNNPPICFELPSVSGLNKQIQSAQLRRWSEAAAHAVSILLIFIKYSLK